MRGLSTRAVAAWLSRDAAGGRAVKRQEFRRRYMAAADYVILAIHGDGCQAARTRAADISFRPPRQQQTIPFIFIIDDSALTRAAPEA